MSNWVNGQGSSSAKLMVIGEAPGKHEDLEGIPFCGPSGELVNKMLHEAGIERSSCYVTNVVKVRPPDNDLKRLSEINYKLDDFIPTLHAELNCVKPNCILALGNLALKTLTNHEGINHYRGSILRGIHGGKVVPSVHPANLLEHRSEGIYNWKSKAFLQLDFNRAVEESLTPEFNLPVRNLWICRDSLNLMRYLERNDGNELLAVDVETFHTIPICIAFAFSSSEAISIPLLNVMSSDNPEGIGSIELATIWSLVADTLANEKIKKIGQNFKFDERILRDVGFRIKGFISDTMLKFHSCYPEFPKKLEFQTSILTREPFYKSEGSEYNYKKDPFSKLLLYNARDAIITYEINEILEKEIEEYRVKSFFYTFMMPLHRFYYELEDNGLLLDKKRHVEVIKKYEAKKIEEEEKLFELAGHSVNVNSSKQIQILLYNELKVPLRIKRRKSGKSTPSTDENVLMSLLANVVKDDKRRDIINGILRIRGYYKTLGTYLGVAKYNDKKKRKVGYEDADGRVRTSYLICGTETGRTSTNKLEPPVRDGVFGLAFQNITKHSEEGRDIRSCFIPSPGYTFIEADQSQAESRIALLLAKEYEQLELMNKIDIHILRASWITEKTYEEEMEIYKNGNDYNRQIGKHSGHANDNGVGKKRLVELVYHHSGGKIIISEWRAGEILKIINKNIPGIQNIFHAGIQQCLERDRTLIDPYGRKRTFFNRWGDELFKEAYAHIKQSVVTAKTQRAGMAIRQQLPYVRMLVESHDSLLMEVPSNNLHDACRIIKCAFEEPIDFSKCSLPRDKLIIPCDIKVSTTNWNNMQKYKVPSALEFLLSLQR
jgi:uracil-DNA glycosylase family 4